MEKISVVFFGTHRFAVSILKGLLQSPLIHVELVVTQPDKPVGRRQELTAAPVKQLALEKGLSYVTPDSLKQFDAGKKIYDFFIVAQYGKLIPTSVLDLPTYGTVNVHTSLLPQYRGASPIQSAILGGETKTGVTIMLMDEGLDTGPILSQKEINILPDDYCTDVEEKLATISPDLLLESIVAYKEGTLKARPQADEDATLCKKISKEEGQIDWSGSTKDIYNRYRAFTPWPGVWTRVAGKRLKLIELSPHYDVTQSSGVIRFIGDKIYVGTNDGSIEIKKLQLEGKTIMNASECIRGYASIKDSVLESTHHSKIGE